MNYLSVFLLFIVCLFAGCSSESDTLPQHQSHHQPTGGLQLNKGQKWQADAATTENVAQLHSLLIDFQKGNYQGQDEAFQDLGKEVKLQLKHLFSECRMQGPAHDELHKFLLPIMEKSEQLLESDAESGPDLVRALEEQLALYPKYFQ